MATQNCRGLCKRYRNPLLSPLGGGGAKSRCKQAGGLHPPPPPATVETGVLG